MGSQTTGTNQYTGYGTVRSIESLRKKYRSVSVPADLVEAAERVVAGEHKHGYTSASGLMADAIRRRLEELRNPGVCHCGPAHRRSDAEGGE